jgi:small-conductance mechanosensitive channel
MKRMRLTKAVLAAALGACLAAPSSAQVEAAVSMAGAGRATPTAPIAALASLPAPRVLAAPAASASLTLPVSFALAPRWGAAPAAVAAESAPSPAAAAADAVAAPAGASESEGAAVPSAAPAPAPAPVSAAAPLGVLRGTWERFWSGSRTERAGAESAPVVAASGSAAPRSLHALAAAAPIAGGVKAFVAHAAPLAGAGIVVAGAYGLDRGARWAISKVAAKRGLDAHQVAAARLAARIVVWTGAVYLALAAGGASPQVMTTALGAGGTVLTLGLRDLLGNVLQGVNFLFARPFTIGDRVQIDDQAGAVTDLNLTGITLKKDDGDEVKVRHSTLAAKAVIVVGPFAPSAAHLHFALPALPARPKFSGAARAVWTSLDRGFWLSSAGFAALLAAPHFAAVLATGAAAKLVGWGVAGALVWLTRSVDRALSAAVDALAEHNGWRLEARVLGRLAVHAAAWVLGGGAALRVVGLSWETLAASLGLTTVVIGLASNNFFGSVLLGVETMFSRPFQIGDRVRLGANEGVVADMNFAYVVIQLDENRRLQVPYAVVRDSVVVVHPGNNRK